MSSPKRVYINMTDDPIKTRNRDHYTAIPNHNTIANIRTHPHTPTQTPTHVTTKALQHIAFAEYTDADTCTHKDT